MIKISLLVFLALGFWTGCTGGARDDGAFHTYTKEKIQGLDPALVSDTYSRQSLMQVYEGLLHFHYLKRPVALEPLLAQDLPVISPDGLTYTFKIKKGVRFQDSEVFPGGHGRELTARDFIYSWKRLADPRLKSENYWVFRGKVRGLDEWRSAVEAGKADYDTPVAGFEAPDDLTLILHLTAPDYQLLPLLAAPMTVAVPREAVEKLGPEFGAHPVGTGAYRFVSWARGSLLTLEKNPTYREEHYPTEGAAGDREAGRLVDSGARLPLIDKILIHEIVEEQPQWLSFQKGDLDMVYVPKDYLGQAVHDGKIAAEFEKKGMSLQLAPATDVVYISLNTENRFLKNKKVREAIAMAYDKEAMLKTFFSGLGTIAHGPIPPMLAGYRAEVKSEYNVERAKQLLNEAGFPNGKGLPEFTMELGASHSTARQMAEFFQQHMAAIGIRVKLHINTWAQFSEKIKKKQADIFDMSWNADYPDAENFLQLFYSKNISPGPNNSNFKNAAFDALYEKSRLTPPGAERDKLYAQMEDLLIDEAPWIFNVHRTRVVFTQSWLKNYKHEYVILDGMKYYRIDAKERARLKPTF